MMFVADPVPITECEGGVLRISGTRVPVDTVIAAFEDGATAEEIVQQYPSLLLADVYQFIAYYLRHKSDLACYLAQRRQHAVEVRAANEARWSPAGIRERLLARQRERK